MQTQLSLCVMWLLRSLSDTNHQLRLMRTLLAERLPDSPYAEDSLGLQNHALYRCYKPLHRHRRLLLRRGVWDLVGTR